LSENINLPNSLLSRFDLLYLILDIADVDRDMALARRTFVHQNEEQATDAATEETDAAATRALTAMLRLLGSGPGSSCVTRIHCPLS
jgi:DNA replicative helicase MCM subunit Mcm2 (Cdc46/Mcm family)